MRELNRRIDVGASSGASRASPTSPSSDWRSVTIPMTTSGSGVPSRTPLRSPCPHADVDETQCNARVRARKRALMERVNVGCGRTPTPGWTNIDNSPSLHLAAYPRFLTALLGKLRVLSPSQRDFIKFARGAGIRRADATRRIPLEHDSADVVYASHMLEHLDRRAADQFLREAQRVLAAGGVLRLAVPDLRRQVEAYFQHLDADRFMEETRLGRDQPRGWRERIAFLMVGGRRHAWMYDGDSLVRLLQDSGFENPQILPAGETTIPDPGPLDLTERADQSVYVEARAPGSRESRDHRGADGSARGGDRGAA